MRIWFTLLCVLSLVSAAAAQQPGSPKQGGGKAKQENGEAAQKKGGSQKAGSQKGERAVTDAYSGKTVRNRQDGMGLLRFREKRAPKVGQVAPALKLTTADGKRVIDLQSFRGKRPVVLVFGSYT